MCSSYRDLSAHRAALLVLFYHCRNVLRTGILRLVGSSREKVYPSLTVRACDGLSWDSPAGIELSKAVPAVMDRWEFVNVRL